MTDKKYDGEATFTAFTVILSMLVMLAIGVPMATYVLNRTIVKHAESGKVYQVGNRHFKIIEVEPEFKAKGEKEEK